MTEDTLKDVMATVLGITADSINGDTSMDTVEAWDSIKHMNLVLAIEVLEHVPRPELLVREMARVVKPGGKARCPQESGPCG